MSRNLKRKDLVRLGYFLKNTGFLDRFDPEDLMGYRYVRLGNERIEVEYNLAYDVDVRKIIRDIYPADIISIGWDTADKAMEVIEKISYKLNPDKFKWFNNPDERNWKHYEIQTRVEKCVLDFVNFYRNIFYKKN